MRRFRLRRIPIRWRLAGGAALLTLVILLGFAVAVGILTTRRLEDDFDARITSTAAELVDQIPIWVSYDAKTGSITPDSRRFLRTFASPDKAIVQLYQNDAVTRIYRTTPGAHSTPPFSVLGTTDVGGYRFRTNEARIGENILYVQYGRPLSEVAATKDRIRLLLGLGVLGGALFALIAGLVIARNAMRPIARLTATARKVAQTRDPEQQVPQPGANDEVGKLATTFNDMLAALAESREESEASLSRQRQFVTDASHELRTPLTSVLANLELLVDRLQGDDAEAAGSALRSTQRMRRLVADLLLLARADVRSGIGLDSAVHAPVHAPVDLGQVVVDVASELGSVAGDHVLELDVRPTTVDGERDQLHRMVLNLVENALRHTPGGTRVTVSVEAPEPALVRLVVEDDGPGIDATLQQRIFERFVRGEGDRGGSVGLGLSIVRAVVDAHKGSVSVERAAHGGARFVVDLPAVHASEPLAVATQPALPRPA